MRVGQRSFLVFWPDRPVELSGWCWLLLTWPWH